MSLILDALNRADQEREAAGAVPTPVTRHDGFSGKPDRRFPVAGALGVLVLLVGAIGAWYLSGGGDAGGDSPGGAQAHPAVVEPVVSPAGTEPQTAPRDTPAPAPEGSATDPSLPAVDPAVLALYEARSEPSSEPEPVDETPAESVRPETSPPVEPADEPVAASAQPQYPNILDLPASIRDRIPSMIYTDHVYTPAQQARFVVLNGEMRLQGASAAPGVRVEQILENRVVLSFEGRRFSLHARNSWVNH